MTEPRTGRNDRTTGRALRCALVAALLALAACSVGDADEATTGPGGPGGTGPQGHDGTGGSVTTTTTPGGERASGPSVGCGATPVVPPGTTDERITSGGVERSYQLIVPEGYDGTTPVPVVLAPHSLTVDYRMVPAMTGFGDVAAARDVIGVSPSGLLAGGRTAFWNAAPVEDNYDLTFLTELLDHLEATLCVDTGAVFSVGMSNGAQISSLLACRIGDRIAGIAPIAGVEYNEPCEGPPVPVIAFHGLEDPIVPYDGGGLSSVRIADMYHYRGDLPDGVATPTGVDESMSRWADHNGCEPEPVEERVSPEVRKRTWQDCEAATVLYMVDNGGHAWPGKPQPAFEEMFGHGTTEIDASSLVFEFFLGDEG